MRFNRSTLGASALVGAAIVLTGCSSNNTAHVSPSSGETAETRHATDSASTTSAENAAQIVVRTSGGNYSLRNPRSIEKWAADVNRRAEDSLVAKCWTFPPQYVQDRYLGDVPRLAEILSNPPGGSQAGAIWSTEGRSDGDVVLLSWAEEKSDYACPQVQVGGDYRANDEYVGYRVKRYILRAQGRPVNPNDTPANYPLECGLPHQRGGYVNTEKADPDNISVTRVDELRWTATSGPVTFDVGWEPSEPCIRSSG